MDLTDALARATGAAFFGLDAAVQLPRGAYGIVEYAAASASTVEDALGVFVRCHALSSSRARIAMHRENGRVTLEHWIDDPASVRATHVNEFALATYVSIGTRFLGRRPRFRQVRFMHHTSVKRREVLARFFGAPVVLGAACNALVFDPSLLATPIADSDPSLFEILSSYAVREVADLPARDDLAGEICAAYRALLLERPRQVQAHDVARSIGLSTRSFNRRLAALGTSFRAIEADVKKELALSYLHDRGCSLAEVATRVGFSESSTFIRAFRRWTGHTPNEVRARLHMATPTAT